jgi:hypothetical protein
LYLSWFVFPNIFIMGCELFDYRRTL